MSISKYGSLVRNLTVVRDNNQESAFCVFKDLAIE